MEENQRKIDEQQKKMVSLTKIERFVVV